MIGIKYLYIYFLQFCVNLQLFLNQKVLKSTCQTIILIVPQVICLTWCLRFNPQTLYGNSNEI